MTGRQGGGGEHSLSASHYPALASFFSGYLHEDFVQEHGSPDGALKAFQHDADAGERRRLAHEARALLEAAADVSFETLSAFMRRDLGAAWLPATRDELEALLRAAARA